VSTCKYLGTQKGSQKVSVGWCVKGASTLGDSSNSTQSLSTKPKIKRYKLKELYARINPAKLPL